jgi:hypothetical protein
VARKDTNDRDEDVPEFRADLLGLLRRELRLCKAWSSQMFTVTLTVRGISWMSALEVSAVTPGVHPVLKG